MILKLIEPKTGEAAEDVVAALKNAKDQGKAFVMEWRRSDAQARRWLDGCSCGGGSFD